MPHLHQQIRYVFVILVSCLSAVSFAFASPSVGTINATSHTAHVCHDNTCSTYGTLNFLPTSTTTAVTITDTSITGYIWGDELGWVNLAPTSAGVTVDPNTGILYGTAFSQNGGWVNFRPTNGGVKINSNGEFEGYAWVGGMYGGWIKFDCNVSATCVRTDWVPRGNRPASVFILGSSYFIKPPKVAEEIKSPTVTPKSLTPVISIPSKNITVSITPLTKPLQIGSNTNDVKTLQTFLSKDKTLYPEALISGYFGQATKKAVQKFQLKYKLAKPGDSAYGYVGPATRKKINDLLKKQ